MSKKCDLTEAKLKSELWRCEYCEEKPCRDACPAHCSPADFIMAARVGEASDIGRAALLILSQNPMGGVCGAVCPDWHCMKSCSHKNFDWSIKIPDVQEAIIARAKDYCKSELFQPEAANGKHVAIIGAGPAGLSAAAILSQKGYAVDLFEKEVAPGGMCRLIPKDRLSAEILDRDIEWILSLGRITLHSGQKIISAKDLLGKGYDAVIVSVGLDSPKKADIPGAEHAYTWREFLSDDAHLDGRRVAIIGGGAIGVDCAVWAKQRGASLADIIYRRTAKAMRLTLREREELLEYDIGIVDRTVIVEIVAQELKRVAKLKAVKKIEGKELDTYFINDYDLVVYAIGNTSSFVRVDHPAIFYAGDFVSGATTVVQAVASGKNAAVKVDAYLRNQKQSVIQDDVKSTVCISGFCKRPVPLDTNFFGRPIKSPFILSASPVTDGYEVMKKAYRAGWAGGIMKTAFDNVPIHIPSEYMFALTQSTYANCDNVSHHSLDRVCREIEKLVVEYPDRLTLGSTGGPVTGNAEHDKAVWQSNTKKLERAGAMGIEYSLSCPQGGDGTEGDIVSQNAKLTAQIIDWVMEIGDPNIPKLFKLTAAVTSIYPIADAIKKVFAKYPNKKAGITLANSFPAFAFRKNSNVHAGEEVFCEMARSRPSTCALFSQNTPSSAFSPQVVGDRIWNEEGVIVGMSGEGVTWISNLTLANVARLGLDVSGNGGPMDYKAAAYFLALGAKTVQFCTVAMKYGVGIIEDLEMGLSYFLRERGCKNISEWIGCALPKPVTEFMKLSEVKKVSSVDALLCAHCGNCTRCPYLAISLNDEKIPVIDSTKCIGCSICVQKCFTKALSMRERTDEEKNAKSTN